MPREYSARITVSDEYKETDVAIGLTNVQASFNARQANTGINDMNVYCKWLKTESFARHIAKSDDPEVIEDVRDRIEYNYSAKKDLLTIQFTDSDPLKAASVLDSVTQHLSDLVTEARQGMAKAALEECVAERRVAGNAYHEAQQRYARYADSHSYEGTSMVGEREEAKNLENEARMAYNHYRDVAIRCVRQEALAKRATCVFAVVKPNEVPIDDNSHLAAILLPMLMLSLALTKGYRLYKERKAEDCRWEWGGLFSPWSITMAVWAGMMVLFLIWSEELYPLTGQFYVSIALWIGLMVPVSLITYNLMPRSRNCDGTDGTSLMPRSRTGIATDGIRICKPIFVGLLVVALVMSPMYIYKVYQTVSMFDADDMLNNTRLLAVEGGGQGLLALSSVISQALFLVSLWAYPRVRMWMVVALALCCVTCSLAIMEKGTIFVVVICSLYVMYERGVVRVRTISVVLVVLLGLFFLFNIYRSGGDSESAKDESILDFIGMYVMSPPVAYCTVVKDVGNQFGTNTFEVVYDYLGRFGFGPFEIHQKVQEFVYVPISTNVYTIMQPFFRDFGYAGVAFMAVFYGLMTGYVYGKSKQGSAFFVVIYTFFVQVLVLQFFQENIFLSLSFFVQLSLLVMACTLNKNGKGIE